MRILHVVAGAPTGGAETFSRDAIVALSERGVEQKVICRPHRLALERFAAASIPVEVLSFSLLSYLLTGPGTIRRIAADWQADLVHVWMGRAASFIPRTMPCPVIGWFGGYYDVKYYKNADFFLAITPDMQRYLVEQGIPPDRTFLCHTFGTLPKSQPISRAAFETPDEALLLLVLSRMHWKKGIDTIIRAMVKIPQAYLWLAGDGPEMARYQALSTELELSKRIRFLGWQSDRKALLDVCDICVLPSRYEPFGTVIAEAWSARKPLVAALAAGARQFVRHNDNGAAFPIDDIDALAACINDIHTDPALAARLIENGYRDYQQLFSKEVVIDTLLKIYRDSIAIGCRN